MGLFFVILVFKMIFWSQCWCTLGEYESGCYNIFLRTEPDFSTRETKCLDSLQNLFSQSFDPVTWYGEETPYHWEKFPKNVRTFLGNF